jgi:ATP adenylyltransferase
MKYIREGIDKQDGCVLCTSPAAAKDREHLILYRGKNVYAMLNAYPYNNGHLMVIPYRHTADPDELSDECSLELWKTLSLCRRALAQAFSPDGFNIGINLGRVAGAGIDQHLHIHIVPRWNGDTNYMPVIGETKVISQSLTDAYDALYPAIHKMQ